MLSLWLVRRAAPQELEESGPVAGFNHGKASQRRSAQNSLKRTASDLAMSDEQSRDTGKQESVDAAPVADECLKRKRREKKGRGAREVVEKISAGDGRTVRFHPCGCGIHTVLLSDSDSRAGFRPQAGGHRTRLHPSDPEEGGPGGPRIGTRAHDQLLPLTSLAAAVAGVGGQWGAWMLPHSSELGIACCDICFIVLPPARGKGSS